MTRGPRGAVVSRAARKRNGAEKLLLDRAVDAERSVRLYAGDTVRVELVATATGGVLAHVDLGVASAARVREAARAIVAVRERVAAGASLPELQTLLDAALAAANGPAADRLEVPAAALAGASATRAEDAKAEALLDRFVRGLRALAEGA